ncbi:prolipoprotein diacylglyceryl transferase family protein [Arthrobacter sp. UYEF20]|uniref:prolipoprotein diacylglyceryl transferase family protein n=1 Tax=Arthrobacter sp. UYEF20 TaxID=1756363 RepID=UPI0033980A54
MRRRLDRLPQVGVSFVAFLDAVAPGVLFAQALGRWGNWFNNELYGDACTLPWKLQIHQLDPASGIAVMDASGAPMVLGFFQPTFVYESFWCVIAGFAILFVDSRIRLGAGSVFALYIAGYPAGRFAFELMRSDDANLILGLRVNARVAALVFLAGAGAFIVLCRRPGPRLSPMNRKPGPGGTPQGIFTARLTAGTAVACAPATNQTSGLVKSSDGGKT